MVTNRSIPPAAVIPTLAVRDVVAATDWLCAAFGFRVRLRIGTHRAQLAAGDGSVILTELKPGATVRDDHGVMVRIKDVDAHHAAAVAAGATTVHPPETYPYGERQHTVRDPEGHTWTFTQSVEDVDPVGWGATDVHPDVDPVVSSWGFADPGPIRDELTAAALAGVKTATTSLLAELQADGDLVARPGDRSILLDSAERPVAVLETTEVRILRLADVDDQFGIDEGEGYAGAADWRVEHERYWLGSIDDLRLRLRDPAYTIDDDTLVVAERFELVARIDERSRG
jgi:uncharacterized protein YhfF/uncharacterized glyoxalase superfamily protein PhnB